MAAEVRASAWAAVEEEWAVAAGAAEGVEETAAMAMVAVVAALRASKILQTISLN